MRNFYEQIIELPDVQHIDELSDEELVLGNEIGVSIRGQLKYPVVIVDYFLAHTVDLLLSLGVETVNCCQGNHLDRALKHKEYFPQGDEYGRPHIAAGLSFRNMRTIPDLFAQTMFDSGYKLFTFSPEPNELAACFYSSTNMTVVRRNERQGESELLRLHNAKFCRTVWKSACAFDNSLMVYPAVGAIDKRHKVAQIIRFRKDVLRN